MRLALLHWIIAGAALAINTSAAANWVTVTSSADAGAGSLRQAIIDAIPGDSIHFAPGIAAINLTSAALTINKNLSIVGPGADVFSVQRVAGSAAFRIFDISAGAVTLSGMTIANGSGGNGGGISNHGGALTILDSAISGNLAGGGGSGGGIYNSCISCAPGVITSVTISGSIVSDNSAASGSGGGIYNSDSAQLTVINSTITGNSASQRGGGIFANSAATVYGSTITGNSASIGGGVAALLTQVGGSKSSIIALNTATSSPDVDGAFGTLGFNIRGINSNAQAPATGDQFGVSAAQLNLGPLLYNGGTTRTYALGSNSVAIGAGQADGRTIDQRGLARPVASPAAVIPAGGDGSDIGAYEVQADVLPGCNTLNRVVQNGNDSGTDSLRDVISKVCAGSTITFAPGITTVTLTTTELIIGKSLIIRGPGANLLSVQRSAAAPGFRIFNIAGNLVVTLSGLTIANGDAGSNVGGGIRSAAVKLTLTGMTFTGNVASLGGNGGGLLNNGGEAVITDSTFSGNSASGTFAAGGGGIFNLLGNMTIVNSTISGNQALGPVGNPDTGGGILSYGGTLSLVSSTITGNSADLGGGVCGINGAVITARNTIIALNTSPSGPDVNGALTSAGFNLIGIPTPPAAITSPQFSDQLGVTSQQLNLGLLQFNGGPTRTHALGAGSFARDAGHASGYGNDQRGVPRPTDLAGVINATGGDGSDIGAYEFGVLSLDIDGNGVYDPLTDGVLIIRYLSGITGTALTNGAIGSGAARFTPAAIIAYLDGIKSALDVDGNGDSDALTDGLLLVRFLRGVRGAALSAGAVGASPARTGTQIDDYILTLVP